jgi:hypothetical protein
LIDFAQNGIGGQGLVDGHKRLGCGIAEVFVFIVPNKSGASNGFKLADSPETFSIAVQNGYDHMIDRKLKSKQISQHNIGGVH